MVAWCVQAFAAARSVGRAIVAAPPGHEAEIAEAVRGRFEVEVVAGGASRSESVAAALARSRSELVAVHDAARPLVEPGLIDAMVARLGSSRDVAGVIAATPVTDTVKRVRPGPERAVRRTEDRAGLWAAQTPQVFRTAALSAAHASDPERLETATDDAMLVEAAGGRVLIEPAPARNLKVTTAADLRLAEILLGEREAT
jgi:2-C-methyl-D-erythritol 4-phosphate cytidylyltransferase